MVVMTKYDIGDLVRVGTVEGRIMRMVIQSTTVYEVGYWVDSEPKAYSAYEWELELIEKANPSIMGGS